MQQATKENEEVLFESLLKKLPDNYFEKERVKFLNKVNSSINSALVAHILDENSRELKWKVLSLFEELLKDRTSHRIFIGTEHARTLLEDPLIKAMLDEQIFYMNIYTSHVIFQSPMYLYFARDFVKELKKRMTAKERLQFFVWKRYNGYYLERFRWYREYFYNLYSYTLEPKENVGYEIAAYPDVLDNDLRTNVRYYQSYSTHRGSRSILKNTVKGEVKDS